SLRGPHEQLRFHRARLDGFEAAGPVGEDAADRGFARFQYQLEMERRSHADQQPGRVALADRAGKRHGSPARPGESNYSDRGRARWRGTSYQRTSAGAEDGRWLGAAHRVSRDYLVCDLS